ncbi:MAG: aminotransferase class III-fold pyridoxal phosphate-dependent enzyme [Candidatus Eremiobacteraeota bacterium]|nr:aminotransferase class III-fold pyridoxal phosphate-dependent enzyme [Candidatus Eremiobacteraeota bacterium]
MQTRTSRHWLPFTQMDGFDAPARTFVRGDGNYLEDANGHRVFDAVSSIWTTIHGHGHPHIVDAIARQAATLDHATSLGATNPLADELADRLCALTGTHAAFFASDGASAVEAALKMALQYWQRAGEPERTRFVHLGGSYHGDTTGAMSVSDIAIFKARFGAVTFETYAYDAAASTIARDDVAAVIVEPLVQAAAGIQVVSPDLYDPLREMRPLLIVDEIASGFGRTGTMFAHEQLGLHPDIICIGKGITGGTLALSAALALEPVYNAFLGAPAELKQFFHGHSYAGNPIACSAAIASLELFEREGTLAHVVALAPRLAAHLERLRAHRYVRDARHVGLMAAVQLDGLVAWNVAGALYERGFFTRPIGDAIQFVPPLSTTSAEIDGFFDALEAELRA